MLRLRDEDIFGLVDDHYHEVHGNKAILTDRGSIHVLCL